MIDKNSKYASEKYKELLRAKDVFNEIGSLVNKIEMQHNESTKKLNKLIEKGVAKFPSMKSVLESFEHETMFNEKWMGLKGKWSYIDKEIQEEEDKMLKPFRSENGPRAKFIQKLDNLEDDVATGFGNYSRKYYDDFGGADNCYFLIDELKKDLDNEDLGLTDLEFNENKDYFVEKFKEAVATTREFHDAVDKAEEEREENADDFEKEGF